MPGEPNLVEHYRRIEHAVRCLYLRLPEPLLARIDEPLRRTFGMFRRAIATPLYVRQPLALWRGECAGECSTILCWGKAADRRPLFDILFDAPPSPTWLATLDLPAVVRGWRDLASAADVFVAETTPALAWLFRRQHFLIVPSAVRFAQPSGAGLRTSGRGARSLRSDLERVRRAGYRARSWPYTRERSAVFYQRYLVPSLQARHGKNATMPTFAWVDRLFAVGNAVAVFAPDQTKPDAISIVVSRGDVLWVPLTGARGGEAAIWRSGGLAALYDAELQLARERGMRSVDVGRTLPWLVDGVARYKWKWGYRPILDPLQIVEYAVMVMRSDGPAARRLRERQVVTREGARLCY